MIGARQAFQLTDIPLIFTAQALAFRQFVYGSALV
jgi:hypothetical protein